MHIKSIVLVNDILCYAESILQKPKKYVDMRKVLSDSSSDSSFFCVV